jgi:hypothetical protein
MWLPANQGVEMMPSLCERSFSISSPEQIGRLAGIKGRTIAVRRRIDMPGFSPWSRKSGIDHVEPPFEYIEQMITLRAHLDACDSDGPLLIIPGSYRLGRIPVREIDGIVCKSEAVACLANAGGGRR